jgi:hypothetical protein
LSQLEKKKETALKLCIVTLTVSPFLHSNWANNSVELDYVATSSGKSKISGSGGWDFFSSDGNATYWNGSSIVMIEPTKNNSRERRGPSEFKF